MMSRRNLIIALCVVFLAACSEKKSTDDPKQTSEKKEGVIEEQKNVQKKDEPADDQKKIPKEKEKVKVTTFAECVADKENTIEHHSFPRTCTVKGEKPIEEEGMKQFTSRILGVTFVYPKEWNVGPMQEIEGSFRIRLDGGKDHFTEMSLYTSGDATQDSIADALATSADVDIEKKGIKKEQSTLGGQSAVIIRSTEDASLPVILVVVLPPGRTFQGRDLRFIGIVASREDIQPFGQSLQFVDPGNVQEMHGRLTGGVAAETLRFTEESGTEYTLALDPLITVTALSVAADSSAIRPGLKAIVKGEIIEGNRIEAVAIDLPEPPSLHVTSPTPGEEIGLLFQPGGKVRDGAGGVQVILRDETKTILTEYFATIGDAAEGFRTWSASHAYAEPKSVKGTVEVILRDGDALLESVSIPVTFDTKSDVRVVETYFGKSAGAEGCDDVLSVSHRIPYTEIPMEETMIDLLRGPDSMETEQGLTSFIPDGVLLLQTTFEDGIATLNFNEAIDAELDSCRREGMKAQIMQTMLQFGIVRAARVLVNGKPMEW